jgi:hypothetical protein
VTELIDFAEVSSSRTGTSLLQPTAFTGNFFNETLNFLSLKFLHRFQASELTVRVGEYNLRVTSSTEQEYLVDGIIIHESFDRRTVRNDIALIRMEKKVVFTPDVKHICLPDPKIELEDQSAFVIGTRSTWSHCQALL